MSEQEPAFNATVIDPTTGQRYTFYAETKDELEQKLRQWERDIYGEHD